ncbi:hypothetical protein EON67_07490, partial [archaeon]
MPALLCVSATLRRAACTCVTCVAGRTPDFALASDTTLLRFWWGFHECGEHTPACGEHRVLAGGVPTSPAWQASILLAPFFATMIERADLWTALRDLVRRDTVPRAPVRELSVDELLELVPAASDPTTFTFGQLLTFIPALVEFAPVSYTTDAASIAHARDDAGTMHPAGDKVNDAMRAFLTLLAAVRSSASLAPTLRSLLEPRTRYMLVAPVTHTEAFRDIRRQTQRRRHLWN